MTERRQRRARRRAATPAPTLPRPTQGDAARGKGVLRESTTPQRATRERTVTFDYRHVREEIVAVTIVGALTLGFVITMAFVL